MNDAKVTTNTIGALINAHNQKRRPVELLRLALKGLDAQIAKLQKNRTQLAAMIEDTPAGQAVAEAP